MSTTQTPDKAPTPDNRADPSSNESVVAIDLFCGAGGFSEGLKKATNELGLDLYEAAINHWDTAISTHKENHAKAIQYNSKIEQLDPPTVVEELTGSKDTNVDLLVAGPECTQFSGARGGKPVNEQRRASPWHVLEYLEKLNIDAFIIENVQEIKKWGPTDEDDKPTRDGSVFQAWVNVLNKLGYSVSHGKLRADEYGDPTFRKRFFIIGQKNTGVTLPDPTHSDKDPSLPDKRTAAEIINWDDLGNSIFTRDLTNNRVHTPPKDTTFQRIAKGIERHCNGAMQSYAHTLKHFDRGVVKSLRDKHTVKLHNAKEVANTVDTPFFVEVPNNGIRTATMILRQQSGAHPINSAERSVPTISTSGAHQAVSIEATPLLIPKNGLCGDQFSNKTYRPSEQPKNTITADPRLKIMCPYLVPMYSERVNQEPRTRSIDRPLMTVPASKSPAGVTTPVATNLSQADNTNQSTDADSDVPNLVLCTPEMWPLGVNIKYRMLQANELKQAQGFDSSYEIKGTTTDKKEQIGNAVPVNLAKNLCRHVLTSDAMSLSTFDGGLQESEDVDIPDYGDVVNMNK